MKKTFKKITAVVLSLVIMLAAVPLMSLERANAAGSNSFKTSDKGRAMIENFEGLYLSAYKCPSGVWTIGYGHTGKVDGVSINKGMTITRGKADQLLADDLKETEGYVNSFFNNNGRSVTQAQFDAVVSFTFNAGSGWMYNSGYNINYYLRTGTGTAAQIKETFGSWAHGDNGEVLPGLVTRRAAEAELYLTGTYPDGSVSTPGGSGSTSTGNVFFGDTEVYLNYAPGDYFTDNGKACTNHGTGTCGYTEKACNCKCTFNGKNLGAIQCFGYARYIQEELFSIDSYNNSDKFYHVANSSISTLTSTKLKNLMLSGDVKPGAHIRTGSSEHSMVVTNITNTGFSIIQCNGSNNNEYSGYRACGIGTYTYTWQGYVDSTYGKRGIQYIEMPKAAWYSIKGNTSCSCSESYKGYYKCTTSSLDLTIRSGHGSSYSEVGYIPSGAEVYVSKADGAWAHVTYNGKSGYASMTYLNKSKNIITYDANGGSGAPSEQTVNVGSSATISSTKPNRTGYAFAGWSTSKNATSATYVSGGSIKPTANMTLYAVWTCNCSESYKGYYICTTSSVDLTIRSGHGSSYSAVGYIPSKAVVYVSKADGSWAHVTYNGISGYASMTYLSKKTEPASISVDKSSISLNIADGKSVDVTVSCSGDYTGFNVSQSSYCNISKKSSSGGVYVYTFTPTNTGNDTIVFKLLDNSNAVLASASVKVSVVTEITEANRELNCYVPAGGATCNIYFTPSSTGEYVIYSANDNIKQDLYPVVLLYDSNQQLIASDNGNSARNFRLVSTLEKGKKYHYTVLFKQLSATGNIHVVLGHIYTVKYNANGGSTAPSSQTKDYGADLFLSSSEPTREGYIFKGWSTSSTGTYVSYNAGDVYSENKDITLYAVWQQKAPTNYTITYDANGGSSAPAQQTVNIGSSATISSSTPTRLGYTFLGWSTNRNAASASYLPGSIYKPSGNTTLYAVWKEAESLTPDTTFTAPITYGGQEYFYKFTALPSYAYKFNAVGTGNSNITVCLYNSNGSQSSKKSGTDGDLSFTTMNLLSSSYTYYVGVKYSNSSVTGNIPISFMKGYTLSYNANGGSGAPSPQSVMTAGYVTVSKTMPTRDGYDFIGWSTSSTATAPSYRPGNSIMISDSIKLYAVWAENDVRENAAIPLTIGNTVASITRGGQEYLFKFTPSSSGNYVIYSTSKSDDTRVFLYDSGLNQIAWDDDSGSNYNFRLTYNLTAGKTYYYGVIFYDSSDIGDIPVTFAKA